MKKILIAVDESEASRRAVEFVEGFFKGEDASLTAVNVAESPVAWLPATPYGTIIPWPLSSESDPLGEAYSREEASARAVASREAPAGADVEVVFGEAAAAISAAADDVDADLIVVGSSHKGFLQRLLAGSVSEDLVREAPRPVLVVH